MANSIRWWRQPKVMRLFAVGASLFLSGLARADVTVDQLAYTVKSGNATITGIKSGVAPVDINGALNIPSTIGGYPVVAIAQNAFKGTERITSLVIPDSVTSVGYGAFNGCSALRSVKTGNGLAVLTGNKGNLDTSRVADSGLFGNCIALTDVTIGPNVHTIGYSCFDGCKALKAITIPDTVSHIQKHAFYGCTSLETVKIGNGVQDIEYRAFYGLANLKNVTFGTPSGSALTDIGESAFEGCSVLRNVTFPSKLDNIGQYAFRDCAAMTALELPDSLYTVGCGAFNGCSALRSVKTGNGLAVLTGNKGNLDTSRVADSGLFGNCIALTDVTIGPNVHTIGYSCFDGCKALRTITIPDTVSHIQKHAFYGCTSLETVKIGNGVQDIEYRAFYKLDNLKNVTFGTPEGSQLGDIAESVFEGCSVLRNVVFPAKLDHIGEYAFRGCTAMTALELPDSLYTVGCGAFNGCSALRSVKTGNGLAVLTGNKGNLDTSRVADSGLFGNCIALTDVTIGPNVHTIGYSCFDGCKALKAITIPDTVSHIQKHAFYGCASLETVVIGNGVQNIEYRAFYGDTALRTVSFGRNLDTIDGQAFANCTALHYLTFAGECAPPHLGTKIFDGVNERTTVYAAQGSTGWTAIDQPGLPADGKWQGVAIKYAPPPAGADNPYDFYPYTPTTKSGGRSYPWPGPLMLTTAPFVEGTTKPAALTEIYEESDIYVQIAYDEYWRGRAVDGLCSTLTLTDSYGVVLGSERFLTTAETTDYGCLSCLNFAPKFLQNLPQGWYRITVALNSDGMLAETDYSNNSFELVFRIVEPPRCRVTFNANGGTVAPAFKDYVVGSKLTGTPLPVWVGYEFTGWYTAASGGTKVTESKVVSADVTYYAHWTRASGYKIAYELDGGAFAASAPTSANAGEWKVLPSPAKADCVFGGWQAVSGLDTSCASVSTDGVQAYPWNPPDAVVGAGLDAFIFSNLARDGGVVTLKALWIPRGYTIAYQLDGGSFATEAPEFVWENEWSFLPSPVREGYDFGGWQAVSGLDTTCASISIDGVVAYNWWPTEAIVGAGLPAFIFSNLTRIGGTVTLKALWIERKYALAYELDGGTAFPGTPTSAKIGEWLVLPSPTRAGYRFGGWQAVSGLDTTCAVLSTDGITAFQWWPFEAVVGAGMDAFVINNLGRAGGTVTLKALWTK